MLSGVGGAASAYAPRGDGMNIELDRGRAQRYTSEELRVDSISLGDRRSAVEQRCGPPVVGASPAWSRYDMPSSDWVSGDESHPPVLVFFQPAWPESDVDAWRVQTVCGTVLHRGGELLVRLGDSELTARAALGQPDEELECEPGYRGLVFGDCYLTIDKVSGLVVEIALRKAASPLSELGAPAQALLDGALAC